MSLISGLLGGAALAGGGSSGSSTSGDGSSFGGTATGDDNGLCTWSLQSIIMDLALRAGMDPRTVDATQLWNVNVRGFTVINQYPCTGALQALAQVFLFDPSNYDGVVHFLPRGMDAVATITEDDFVIGTGADGADDPIQDQSSRSDSISIPLTLNLNYFDVDGGLATSLQSSQRVGDPRATGSQDLQTAVILSADEAARVVRINHQVMVEDQKAQINFILSDKWIGLTAADNIFLSYEGKVRRLRITEVDLADGQQSYQLLQDRQSAYVSNVQGYPAYVPTSPPSAIVGPTTIQPLDIHIIADRDDSLGCYLAFTGQTAAWAGALIEVSLDGGASYFTSFNVDSFSVMGTLSSDLPAHPAEYPDDINHCTVDLLMPNAELDSANQTQMQNNANLAIIGNEVIQFGDVNETTTPGTWDMNYFFRGRHQTAPVAHSAGERFVLLERDALYYMPAELSYLGRSLTLRATSFNGTDSDITTITFTYTGQSQVEYAVGYLSARRAGSSGVFSWQGIGKLGSGASVAMGVHSSGYFVTLSDGTTTQTFTQTTQNLTTDLSAFSGPVTCTVQAINNLTGTGPGTSVTV